MFEILNPNLQFSQKYLTEWRTPLSKSEVKYIVIHHPAATDWTVWKVHEYHRDVLEWGGIGYNFYIHKDGKIYKGRGYDQGAGVYRHNHETIHVSLQGEYHVTDKVMPDAQFEAGVWMLKQLKKDFPNAQIVGHKFFGGTVCPGDYFPLNKMINEANKEGDELTMEEKQQLTQLIKDVQKLTVRVGELEAENKALVEREYDQKAATWAEGAIKYVVDNKLMSGRDGSKFFPNAQITRQEVAVLAKNIVEKVGK